MVVGIADSSLPERFQMDSELTLAKAMTVNPTMRSRPFLADSPTQTY